MQGRYFVRVVPRDRQSLVRLSRLGLDLFHPTARRTEGDAGALAIDGLMTLEEIAKLVDGDYEVTVVEAVAARRSTGIEINTFEEWLAGMGGRATD